MSAATPISIEKLQIDITGRVIGPDHADYDQARQVFTGGIDKRPAVVVRVADTDDVARVIALARETGLELAVRSGGHSGAGHSVSEGGIVLDLGDMRALNIDVDGRTAWAETGLAAAEYTAAAAEHGLATGFGDTGSVGIGGITNGGGIGFLSRKFGMTIDSLLEAEVVTADGELHHVDAASEPDLFWALRGGGGNVGVATRLRFRLHEVGEVVGGMMFLPATPDTVAAVVAAAEDADDDLTVIANVMPGPADAVRARGAPRQARGLRTDDPRRRRRGGSARRRPVPRDRHADRGHGPADVVPGDVHARRPRLPPRGGAPEHVPRPVRPRHREPHPRAHRGLRCSDARGTDPHPRRGISPACRAMRRRSHIVNAASC